MLQSSQLTAEHNAQQERNRSRFELEEYLQVHQLAMQSQADTWKFQEQESYLSIVNQLKREEEQQLKQQLLASEQIQNELQQTKLREQALSAQIDSERDQYKTSLQRLTTDNQNALYQFQQTQQEKNFFQDARSSIHFPPETTYVDFPLVSF